MRAPGRHRPDPAFPALKARIIARTGHHYYADKDDLLLDRLHRRLRETARPDCAAYAALLADAEAGPAEWAALEAEITIGETFFFRYAEQFAALRETILPDLIAAREPARTLSIWSAGCSTGAEPYSLAILVREGLGEALPGWRVSILGSDISTEALAVARAAEYGRWALRTMPVEDRLRYFARLPARPGVRRDGGYALRPEFREMVRFERRNLLSVIARSVPRFAGKNDASSRESKQAFVGEATSACSAPVDPGAAVTESFDLILCRNVLIYFDAETVAAVVRGLGRRLRPGGWLLLGHAEPNPAFSAFLEPLSLPGTVAYRRRADAGLAAPVAPPPSEAAGAADGAWPVSPEASAATLPVAAARARPSDPVEKPSDRPAAPAPADSIAKWMESEDAAPEETVGHVRKLADAGETAAAWRALQAGLARDPTDPRLRFYEGLIARTLGREAEAERAFRGALYLDRGFVMAHYHLGLLLLAQDRRAEAVRALDNAVAFGQALPADSLLAEADGATAGDIALGAAAARNGVDGGIERGRR